MRRLLLAASLVLLAHAAAAQHLTNSDDHAASCGPERTAVLRSAQAATQLFQDTFDSGLDTTLNWTTSTGGTGIAATSTTGATVIDGGTTANSFSLLTGKQQFVPTEPGYTFVVMRNNIEFPVVTTAYRFWGLGTFPGSPTVAAPVTQGIGWDIGTNGRLSAVTWQTGTRVVIQDLSAASGNARQPTDSNAHKYYLWFRGDQSYWAIDSVDNIVACFTTGASGPDVNGNALGALAVSNSGTHATVQINAVVVGDTVRNGVNLTATGLRAAGFQPVVSAAGEATHVFKAAPGNLYSVYATNLTATAGFLAVLNATTAPGDGAITPLDCVVLPASGTATINRGAGPPRAYSTGITVVLTSAATCFTKTTGVITGFISVDGK